MAHDVTLTMDGLLINWLKDVGDSVNAGDVLAEFEADKATVEVEADHAGIVLELRADPGDEVSEGTVIAVIGEAGEEAPAQSQSEGKPEKAAQPAEEAQNGATAQAQPEAVGAARSSNGASRAADGRIKASPLARNIAAEKGINLSNVSGTGPGGRIVKADVENYKAPAPALAPATGRQTYGKLPEGDHVEIIEVDRMRRAIADGTILSKTLTPHFYVTVDIAMGPLMSLRKVLNKSLEEEDIKISVNDLLVKATALTLKKFPNLNSHYYGDKIVRYKEINVGIAVALPNNGLINAVSHNADKVPLSEMAVAHKAMFERLRSGKIKSEDIRGATFTTSNLGPYDVDHFAAIISTPESGILAFGSAKQVPIVKEDGTLGVGNRMKVTISVDHRVSDGAEGAEFMQYFRELLENPMRLLV